MCLEMTWRYKLFGIPGDVDEFLDKIKEIKEPVTMKLDLSPYPLKKGFSECEEVIGTIHLSCRKITYSPNIISSTNHSLGEYLLIQAANELEDELVGKGVELEVFKDIFTLS